MENREKIQVPIKVIREEAFKFEEKMLDKENMTINCSKGVENRMLDPIISLLKLNIVVGENRENLFPIFQS